VFDQSNNDQSTCALDNTCLDLPLFVIEYLHRMIDIFGDYFGECTETSLKENYVVVYEVNIVFFQWHAYVLSSLAIG
jgi:hypothetical protein